MTVYVVNTFLKELQNNRSKSDDTDFGKSNELRLSSQGLVQIVYLCQPS